MIMMKNAVHNHMYHYHVYHMLFLLFCNAFKQLIFKLLLNYKKLLRMSKQLMFTIC